MAKGWFSDYALQYLSGIHSQAFGDLCQSGKSHVYFAALDFTHVGTMNLAIIGKCLLGPALCRAQLAASISKLL
jgi:hypothetical protein